MNCLDFRRQLNIDPHAADTAFAQHHADCARCAEALERSLRFEGSLRRALQIAVSPQLADSILLAQATREQQQRGVRRRNALLALAAGVVLAIGLGVSLRGASSPIAALAVDHLNKEAFVLAMRQGISDDEVRKAFEQSGLSLANVPAGISFVYCCPVGPYSSVHLVMPTSTGPVTVLYLTTPVVAQRETFSREGWRGVSMPVGQGSLVLLGHDAGQFERVEHLWRSALAAPPDAAPTRS